MKKLLRLALILTLAALVTSCKTLGLGLSSDDQDNQPLSYPTLPPCSEDLLKVDRSFICIEKQTGPDMIQTNIKFGSDSFTLNNQAKYILNKLYAYLKLSGTTEFTIKGYTGKVDSKLISDKDLLTEHNLRLSRNRAISVREYLINKGLEPGDGITIQALGYQDPIAPNDSSANRALNQRVEISIKSKLVSQIDNIEKHLENVDPSKYTKFFANVYLLNSDQLKNSARIFDSREKRPVLGTNFEIFADKEYPAKDNASNFIIVSEPRPISIFNDDNKLYKLGTAKYDHTYKGITALTITNLNREASVGDYIIPNDIVAQKLPNQTFKMTTKVTANILEDVMNTNSFSSTYNSILINKGTADGLKPGAEMILYEPETRTDGFPVPPKYVGYGFVYRLSDHYSIVLIVNSLQEITDNSMATTTL
jgi:outer membrane protein OmpA-like peptidoglycan-associated protein